MELKLNNISCGYGKKTVIKDLNCCFNQREAVAILGSNGIGKSTLMKNLLRQYSLLNGSITIDNKDINTVPYREMAKYIAYVPQNKECHYNYSVVDLVMMGRAAYLSAFTAPGDDEYEMAMDVLDAIEMKDYAQRNYSMLSGGEQQMVLIARAMIQNTAFILMDEPTANLDFYNQKILLRTINKLKDDGKGIVMISHSPEHAVLCCEKTLLIKRDGGYFYGNTEEILTEENLRAVYGTEIVLLRNDSNSDMKHIAFSLGL